MDVGYFDRTPRGRLVVSGQDRKDLLHRLCTHDVASLREGHGVPAAFCTSKGRLLDWAVVLDRGRDLLLLCGNAQILSGHIQMYTITEDVNVGSYMAVELVVCGPRARELLGVDLEPWRHTQRRIGDVDALVARIEPLGGDAYAVIAADAVYLRGLLQQQARALDDREVARLRVKAGIPSAPEEINQDYNPWEVGLGDSVSMTKGCYVGQEVIARLHHYDKVQRSLCGLRFHGPAEPGALLSDGSRDVGKVTTTAGGIGLGVVSTDVASPGTRLGDVEIVPLPMD